MLAVVLLLCLCIVCVCCVFVLLMLFVVESLSYCCELFVWGVFEGLHMYVGLEVSILWKFSIYKLEVQLLKCAGRVWGSKFGFLRASVLMPFDFCVGQLVL